MNPTDTKKKIEKLRAFMSSNDLDAIIIPSTDPHSGEYVPEYWESRKWISGFTGSAGTVVITLHDAVLWTDSRYFLQAESQLEGTGITLFKERVSGTPSITDWLINTLHKGDNVGIDGFVNTTSDALALKEELSRGDIALVTIRDPFVGLWTDRPALPTNKPFILPIEYTGLSVQSKIEKIKEAYYRNGADGILISALDEIAWTLNMRCNDIHCNPVFISYLLISNNRTTLYMDSVKFTDETRQHLTDNNISIEEYKNIDNSLSSYSGYCLQMSPCTNFTLYSTATSTTKVVLCPSPVLYMKAVKNATEIEGFHNAMLRDGVAMVKFLIWIKEAVKAEQETETSIERKLYQLRSEQKNFRGLSFDTIAGYQEHGAIVHYEATEESAYTLKPKGMMLLDSGGQYTDGTTDITRTIILGPINDEQKTDYTLVLKGMIDLAMAEFPEGTCGTQLDILARSAMWKNGINYGHGTGHGVGHFLNVHEGPHQIRMNHIPSPLLPGMTITDEPGIYRTGKHGIRIENTMIVIPSQTTEFGNFFKFEPLTLCPIDKEGIRKEMLTDEELTWFNNYHQYVFEKLNPLLNEDERRWLVSATSAL